MKIYWTDQKDKLKRHLPFLKTKKVMSDDKNRLTEKVTRIQIDCHKRMGELNFDFLYNYQIFPKHLLTFLSEWEEEGRKIKEGGDTLVQQLYLPPNKCFSQKLIFGVIIKEFFDQESKKGFSYETLEGHVEKGISSFVLEE